MVLYRKLKVCGTIALQPASPNDAALLAGLLRDSRRFAFLRSEVTMTATRPEVIRVTDTSTRDELIEALTHLAFRAAREVPAVGSDEYPTPWDRRHAALNELLTQLEATA